MWMEYWKLRSPVHIYWFAPTKQTRSLRLLRISLFLHLSIFIVMLSSSLLIAFASASLTLAAVLPAPIPIRRGDAVVDIVEVITCTPLAGATGSLAMSSTINGRTSSVALGLVDNVLQEDSLVPVYSQGQKFVFQNCTSTFMNEVPNAVTYYG